AQDVGDARGKAPERLLVGVDQEPALLDLVRLGGVGLHRLLAGARRRVVAHRQAGLPAAAARLQQLAAQAAPRTSLVGRTRPSALTRGSTSIRVSTRAAMSGCRRTTASSTAVSGSVLARLAAGTPTLPTSCRAAAWRRRRCSRSSSASRSATAALNGTTTAA